MNSEDEEGDSSQEYDSDEDGESELSEAGSGGSGGGGSGGDDDSDGRPPKRKDSDDSEEEKNIGTATFEAALKAVGDGNDNSKSSRESQRSADPSILVQPPINITVGALVDNSKDAKDKGQGPWKPHKKHTRQLSERKYSRKKTEPDGTNSGLITGLPSGMVSGMPSETRLRERPSSVTSKA